MVSVADCDVLFLLYSKCLSPNLRSVKNFNFNMRFENIVLWIESVYVILCNSLSYKRRGFSTKKW